MRRRYYIKKNVAIDYTGAVVGDILCSDMSFVTRANYSASGKIAIGIIINNSNRAISVIALTEVTDCSWSYNSMDISDLINISTSYLAQADIDGKGNTDKIIAANTAHAGSDYAAGWCRLFTTTGTKAGDWHLPALGELYLLSVNADFMAVSQSIVMVGAIPIFVETVYKYYVTSTEETSTYVWIGYTDGVNYTFKSTDIPKYDAATFLVRPFMIISY